MCSAMEVDEPSKAETDAAATETVKPVILVNAVYNSLHNIMNTMC